MQPFWLTDFVQLIRHYKLRFMLAILIISMGFAALVTMILLEFNVDRHLQRLFSDIAAGSFSAQIATKHAGDKKTLKQHFYYPAIQDTLTIFPAEMQVFPFQVQYAPVMWQGTQIESQWLFVHPDMLPVLRVALEHGRWIDRLDQYEKIVLVGSAIASLIKQKGINPLETAILLNGRYYPIVGVLAQSPTHPLLDVDLNHAVVLHYALHQQMGHGALQSFYVHSNDNLSHSKQIFKQLLQENFQIQHVFIKDANLYLHVMMQQVSLTLRILRWVTVINLSFGCIVLLTILGLLMEERIPEMGLRICIGGDKKQLIWMFIREALILCFVGGIAGIVFGMPIAYIVIGKLGLLSQTALFDMLGVICKIFSVVALAALTCGLITGVVPAFIAGKKQPIDLLK